MRRFVLATLAVALVVLPAAGAFADECTPVPPVTRCATQAPTPPATPPPSSSPSPTPTANQAGAAANRVDMEREFFELINRERRTRGMRSLAYNAVLTDVARDHSARMASEGRLYHNTGELRSEEFARRTNYPTMVGENVGEGPSVEWLHDAFMGSPGHRSNIIESRYTAMGIGVTVKDGTIWVTQDFIQERVPTRASFPRAPIAPRTSLPSTVTRQTGPAVPSAAGNVAPIVPPAPKISALRLPPIPAPVAAPVPERRRPLMPLAVLATLSAVAFASRRDAGAWI